MQTILISIVGGWFYSAHFWLVLQCPVTIGKSIKKSRMEYRREMCQEKILFAVLNNLNVGHWDPGCKTAA